MTEVDRLFFWVRSQPFFLRMTVFTRILLAAGFIPTGMVKLLGHRFTLMSVETPVGAFFEAMYQTGMYWRFLGASQVLAGCLLLIPRLGHLGAALFVPIMANIVVVTISIGFRGTPYVTVLMLLAVLYLCAWDYHRFRSIFTESTLEPALAPPKQQLDPLERIGFIAFGLSLMAFFFAARGTLPRGLAPVSVIGGFAAGLFTLGRFLWLTRRRSVAAKVEG